jgi:hypothetical protein
MDRRRVFTITIAPAVLAALVGALVAGIVAIVASRWMPIGPARVAEPAPGIRLDPLVLVLGFVAVALSMALIAAWPAWRTSRTGPEITSTVVRGGRRVVRLDEWAARAGAPVSMAVGVGHASTRWRGRSAVPTRSAFAGVAVALAAIAGAMTFGVNLSRLVQTPRLYGQTWDITADAQFSVLRREELEANLRKEPGAVGWTFGKYADLLIDGHAVPAIELEPGSGTTIVPRVVAGHAPRDSGEVTLGAKTLHALHRTVGATVQVGDAEGGSAAVTPMHVVGRSVFPFFGRGSFTPAGLGVGAQLLSATHTASSDSEQAGPNFVLIKVDGGSAHARDVARIARDLVGTDLCGLDNQCQVTTASRPVDILNYARVRSTPVVLAIVLAVLGVLVVAYLLMASLRRRRRDYAILRTLGFTHRQIWSTVASQATTLVVFGLVVGIPLGLVLGRAAWSTFASNAGIPSDPVSPAVPLIVTTILAVLLANATAVAPAVIAVRTPPAPLLRTD